MPGSEDEPPARPGDRQNELARLHKTGGRAGGIYAPPSRVLLVVGGYPS